MGELSMGARREITKKYAREYASAGKLEKGRMLDELCGATGWSRVHPLSYVVEAERALFAGDLVTKLVLWGFIAASATAAVGLVVGIRSMRQSD